MNQSNLAAQQPEEEPTPSAGQLDKVEKPSLPSSIPVPKVGAQKTRLPEQQAEVERIGQIKPFVGLQRDEDLFTRLNHWRDLGICARVITMDRLGLFKSLEFYAQTHTRRRSGLLVTPAPVVHVEIEQAGSPINLFLAILEYLVNPLDCGYLRQLRSRVWGTLKAYKVKLLIVSNVDVLSFAAFFELMRIAEKLGIAVVLAGSPLLNEMIDPKAANQKKYINIYNTFLKWHPYTILTKEDIPTVISEWERNLGWSQPLNLWSDIDIVTSLEAASQRQLRVLYENLKEIATWKMDHPKAQVNFRSIASALELSLQPMSRLQDK